MPVSADLHLRGHLEEGPHGLLLLRTDGGGEWELETRSPARRLVGQEVEVAGQRAGFNGLICDQLWPAGQPRPRSPRIDIEHLVAAGIAGFGIFALLATLIGYLR